MVIFHSYVNVYQRVTRTQQPCDPRGSTLPLAGIRDPIPLPLCGTEQTMLFFHNKGCSCEIPSFTGKYLLCLSSEFHEQPIFTMVDSAPPWCSSMLNPRLKPSWSVDTWRIWWSKKIVTRNTHHLPSSWNDIQSHDDIQDIWKMILIVYFINLL